VDFALAAVAVVLYFVGRYDSAFWLIIFALLINFFAIARSFGQKRPTSNLQIPIGLKIITVFIWASAALWLARLLGYLA
jgi:hypothetical protein